MYTVNLPGNLLKNINNLGFVWLFFTKSTRCVEENKCVFKAMSATLVEKLDDQKVELRIMILWQKIIVFSQSVSAHRYSSGLKDCK